MIKYKYIGEDYNLPERFDEIPTYMFCSVFQRAFELVNRKLEENEFDNIEFLSEVLAIDYDVIYNLPIEIAGKLVFLLDLIDMKKLAKFDGNTIINETVFKKRIFNQKVLQKESIKLGQLELGRRIVRECEVKHSNKDIEATLMRLSVEAELSEEEKNQLWEYDVKVFSACIARSSELAAIVLFASDGRSLDNARIVELARRLDKLPFKKVVPYAFFFLKQSHGELINRILFYLARQSSIYLTRQKNILKKVEDSLTEVTRGT
jgi:hypothetical protein